MSYPFDVYDLSFPSPITLKEIAMNKIVIELWRREIHKHRSNGTLKKLEFQESISSDVLLPYVPPVLLTSIDKKISRVGKSIKNWVDLYTENDIFQWHVLRDFDDLVCDFDCFIHYEKTAKRMIQCDEISPLSKFKIACLCCFEVDIELLWPSVSSQFHLKDINFEEDVLLYYWICRLRKQWNEIPLVPVLAYGGDLNAFMFSRVINKFGHHWSSVEYFFNRIRLNFRILRWYYTSQILIIWPQNFFRYSLAKMNEAKLNEFLMENREILWDFLFYDKLLIFWTYMKHRISVYDFVWIIKQALRNSEALIEGILLEIWISAPDHFKQPAMQRLIREYDAFAHFTERHSNFSAMASHLIEFLLIALPEASFPDRRMFWGKNWAKYIQMTNTNELQKLTAICFENETEIIRFKEKVTSEFWIINEHCGALLETSNFKKLNEVLNLYVIGEQNIKNIRLRLLIRTLEEKKIVFDKSIFEKADLFNKFINDAYDDDDRATAFKKQLLSSPRFAQSLRYYIKSGWLHFLRGFIETLLPSEPKLRSRINLAWLRFFKESTETPLPSETIMKNLKKKVILPSLQQCPLRGCYLGKSEYVDYQDLLHWCSENYDETAKFKQTLPIDT